MRSQNSMQSERVRSSRKVRPPESVISDDPQGSASPGGGRTFRSPRDKPQNKPTMNGWHTPTADSEQQSERHSWTIDELFVDKFRNRDGSFTSTKAVVNYPPDRSPVGSPRGHGPGPSSPSTTSNSSSIHPSDLNLSTSSDSSPSVDGRRRVGHRIFPSRENVHYTSDQRLSELAWLSPTHEGHREVTGTHLVSPLSPRSMHELRESRSVISRDSVPRDFNSMSRDLVPSHLGGARDLKKYRKADIGVMARPHTTDFSAYSEYLYYYQAVPRQQSTRKVSRD